MNPTSRRAGEAIDDSPHLDDNIHCPRFHIASIPHRSALDMVPRASLDHNARSNKVLHGKNQFSSEISVLSNGKTNALLPPASNLPDTYSCVAARSARFLVRLAKMRTAKDNPIGQQVQNALEDGADKNVRKVR